MGCKCTKGLSRASTETPPVNLSKISDPFVKFEKSFPFYRMHIENFRQQIYNLGKDEIRIEDLKNRFEGAIWKDHFNEDSELTQLLKALPDSNEDMVNINSILILGLLWCSGDYDDKSEAFFQLLNPPG